MKNNDLKITMNTQLRNNMKVTLIRSISVLAFLFTFASCSSESVAETPTNTSTPTVSTPANDSYTYSAIELEIANLINQYRTGKGLSPLQKINHISNVSQAHNEYMISINTLTHDRFSQRADNLESTLGAIAVGENIAYNYSTARSVVDAWINSASHKANIEGNYTHFGIAVKTNAAGEMYFTNMFIRK